MLDQYPSRRLMLADIIAHPWMQGEIPTKDEIRKEFDVRTQESEQ